MTGVFARSSWKRATLLAFAAVLSTAGLYYLWGLCRVTWHSVRASSRVSSSSSIVVLGKRLALQAGRWQADQDFEGRLIRAQQLAAHSPLASILITGGPAEEGGVSEAEVGKAHLLALGVTAPIVLESQAQTTAENFLLIRPFLGREGVTLVSSRYHLGRCRALGRKAGVKVEVVGAEERFTWSWRQGAHLVREAACLVVLDFWRAPAHGKAVTGSTL